VSNVIDRWYENRRNAIAGPGGVHHYPKIYETSVLRQIADCSTWLSIKRIVHNTMYVAAANATVA